MQNESSPAIYVACLAAYNNGMLHGRWIDATQKVNVIQAEVKSMLAQSPEPEAEEWAVHDYDNFGDTYLGEWIALETVHKYAVFLAEHGDLGAALLTFFSDNLTDAKNALQEHHGVWESELDFATNLFDDVFLPEMPSNLRFYIDYLAFCRDLFLNDYFSIEVNGETHVFLYC